MRVLFLGADDSPVLAHLRAEGEDVVATDGRIDGGYVREMRGEIIVSHGYRHILRGDALEVVPAVNLHIAYLPWNRGADPNLWSWIENTPKGVTIHHIDEGVDTGDVIAQREVAFDGDETLASSYARLQDAMLELFRDEWPAIRAGTSPRTPQQGEGSAHRIADKQRVEHLLTDGWSTPVAQLAVEPL